MIINVFSIQYVYLFVPFYHLKIVKSIGDVLNIYSKICHGSSRGQELVV